MAENAQEEAIEEIANELPTERGGMVKA